MNHNNELINRYIDNELSDDELNQVEELINRDRKFKSLLTVHQYVHETLYQIPLKKAPFAFTESVMNKISSRLSDKYRKNYYFRFVISVISSILLITLFMFFYFLGDLTLFQSASEITLNFSDKILPSFSSLKEIFNSSVFKTISGLLGFVILVIFYFNYNTHRQLKDTLKKL